MEGLDILITDNSVMLVFATFCKKCWLFTTLLGNINMVSYLTMAPLQEVTMVLDGERLPELDEVDLETIFNQVRSEDLETFDRKKVKQVST